MNHYGLGGGGANPGIGGATTKKLIIFVYLHTGTQNIGKPRTQKNENCVDSSCYGKLISLSRLINNQLTNSLKKINRFYNFRRKSGSFTE